MRTNVIAGNWKMNKTNAEAVEMLTELKGLVKDVEGVKIVIGAPFTALSDAVKAVEGSNVEIAAENVYPKSSGAYTGEVSPTMLKAIGVKYVILGHSERREYFKESNEFINEKVKAVLAAGMTPILCVGEKLEDREAGRTAEVNETQVREGKEKGNSKIDWDDVVFEVDLLKSQEINLDYILELIYEKNKNTKDKNILIDEIRRIVRASTGNRAKESLIVAFINQTDLDEIQDKASIIDAFFQFAQKEQKREAEELIMEEKLNEEAAKRYILTSLRKEYASENGTDLNEILPKMSPLNPQYHTKKQSVFEKISTFVEKFKGVGGVI